MCNGIPFDETKIVNNISTPHRGLRKVEFEGQIKVSVLTIRNLHYLFLIFEPKVPETKLSYLVPSVATQNVKVFREANILPFMIT